MTRSKKKLAVEVGLLYEIWIGDENLEQTTISNDLINNALTPPSQALTFDPTSPEHLVNPTPSSAKFFSISQPIAPQPTCTGEGKKETKHKDTHTPGYGLESVIFAHTQHLHTYQDKE